MPNITVIRDDLFASIGRTFTDAEFDEVCFEFGVEVDDIATETVEFVADGTKEECVVYVIAIPANRYDLLCIEGFARALRVFLGLENRQVFRTVEPVGGRQIMRVKPAVASVRPYMVCAILRGVKFDKKRYKSFIDLQEKLHQNICRRRTYVSMGTHDLDTVSGPFTYDALPPQDINFVPLTESFETVAEGARSFNGKELMDFYREDPTVKHLKPYTDIIYDSPLYPVVLDASGAVMSLPPVINGKHSRIKMTTTNVLIEATNIDKVKANIVLDTMITMFSEYCAEPFTCEPVDVVYEEDGHIETTPLLSTRVCEASVKEINGTIGIDITPQRMCELCDKMQLGPAEHVAGSDCIRVTVPPTRSDILHAVDVIEDVAIAYGYNNIFTSVPPTNTVGAPLPINQFTDLLRAEIARAGYVELLSHGLCSRAENFTDLRRPETDEAVSLANPANVEYEVVRTTLIPGTLKTLAHNRSISHKDGIRLFEISDVVVRDRAHEVGCRNVRHICALYASHSAGFEFIHGMVDKIMLAAQVPADKSYALTSLSAEEVADQKRMSRDDACYFVKPGNDPVFFPSMAAEVVMKYTDAAGTVTQKKVGVYGVVHPEVLEKYEISYPCSLLELNLEDIM
jgi:phenylalanyl-tRNA synthetase beta chain